MLKAMLDYLLAFSDRWLFWIGIVMLIGDLIEKKAPKLKAYLRLEKWLPTWVFVGLAILCFFLAGFQIWHEEYKKTSPGLQLVLDEYGFVGDLAGIDKTTGLMHSVVGQPGSLAFVVATIKNLGYPTVADNWKLVVTLPDKTEVTFGIVDFNLPADQKTVTMGDDVLSLNKLLYRQTLTPIATGDKKQGFLAFFTPSKQLNGLPKNGTTMYLTCQDVADNIISSPTVVWKGDNQGHKHFIGLE
jgi:hypothetical protein